MCAGRAPCVWIGRSCDAGPRSTSDELIGQPLKVHCDRPQSILLNLIATLEVMRSYEGNLRVYHLVADSHHVFVDIGLCVERLTTGLRIRIELPLPRDRYLGVLFQFVVFIAMEFDEGLCVGLRRSHLFV